MWLLLLLEVLVLARVWVWARLEKGKCRDKEQDKDRRWVRQLASDPVSVEQGYQDQGRPCQLHRVERHYGPANRRLLLKFRERYRHHQQLGVRDRRRARRRDR